VTVGAPGAGIGGLFYLASAIVLPVRSVWHAARGGRVAWGAVFRQWLLAVAVLGAIWLAGWLIGLWAGPALLPAGERGLSGVILRSTGVLATAMLYASVATLGLVLGLVQVAAFMIRRGTQAPAPHQRPVQP
jgi:hypothetical protein